jgi:hypothetical protein
MQQAEWSICQSFANHTRRVYRRQNWREACAWIKETNDLIRAQFNEKIFPCPGQCGSCTGASMHGMPK